MTEETTIWQGTTITTHFYGLAEKKLKALLADGWEINGVSIRRVGEHHLIHRGAVTTGGMVLWWHNSQQIFGLCKHCHTPMQPGIAIQQTYTAGEPDFPSGQGDPNAIVTLSPGGSGKLIECLKCPQCGWSVTKGE